MIKRQQLLAGMTYFSISKFIKYQVNLNCLGYTFIMLARNTSSKRKETFLFEYDKKLFNFDIIIYYIVIKLLFLSVIFYKTGTLLIRIKQSNCRKCTSEFLNWAIMSGIKIFPRDHTLGVVDAMAEFIAGILLIFSILLPRNATIMNIKEL